MVERVKGLGQAGVRRLRARQEVKVDPIITSRASGHAGIMPCINWSLGSCTLKCPCSRSTQDGAVWCTDDGHQSSCDWLGRSACAPRPARFARCSWLGRGDTTACNSARSGRRCNAVLITRVRIRVRKLDISTSISCIAPGATSQPARATGYDHLDWTCISIALCTNDRGDLRCVATGVV